MNGRILVFDPSGNFSKNEGSGTSGWSFFDGGELKEFGDIKADASHSIESYWWAHTCLLKQYRPKTVVCESYKLQPNKAMAQSYSSLETPQLIGVLRFCSWELPTERFILQDPSIKIRVADPILERMGVIEKRGNRYYCQGRMTNEHMRDAIRHGIYFQRYGDKRGKTTEVKRPV